MAENVLVLSGGGAHGAFEVGVIKKLVEVGHSWDFIAGVSVGAINAAFLAQYPRAFVSAAVNKLERFWLEIEGNKSIFKPWLFRDLSALWRGGIHNTKPLRRLITANLDPLYLKNSGVRLLVGATCLETGDYTTADGTDPNIGDWVLASAAFPVMFPPVMVNGKHYVDGGLRNVTPFEDVLNGGHDAGDVILCQPNSRSAGTFPANKTQNALAIAMRSAVIMNTEVAWDDLTALTTSKGWQLFTPPQAYTDDSLTFDPTSIRKLIADGYDLATKQLGTTGSPL